MPTLPIVLLHGWSATGESMARWASILSDAGRDVRICHYKSLTNEITVHDLAEGLDRALRVEAGLKSDEEFDCIVHSTGMLVIRSWLAQYAQRRSRLKHLIGLAPATFGSPLAHKGRSFLGGIFKGNKAFGQDFLEAGDQILRALELASPFTWDLAEREFLGDSAVYGPGSDTPYVFIFCGTDDYGGLADLFAKTPGGDGTVRWAGCPLNTRQFCIDLRHGLPAKQRWRVPAVHSVDCPLFPVPKVNHGTILSKPPGILRDLVIQALQTNDEATWQAWHERAEAKLGPARDTIDHWQQFVIRLRDERGQPVPDWYLELRGKKKGDRASDPLTSFALDVHKFAADTSYRCFHVNLKRLEPEKLTRLEMKIVAESGSEFITYTGHGDDRSAKRNNPSGRYAARINVTSMLTGPVTLFYPLTTTLIDITLDREPQPLDPTQPNRLVYFR